MGKVLLMKNGCGGSSSEGVNIKFISVPNENTLPEKADKNLIAVLYNGELGEWQMSVSGPVARADGTELMNGDLWFTGYLSEDELLPSLVYVYSDGTWNTTRFAVYQDDAWIWLDSRFSLYNYNKPMGYMAGEMLWKGFMMNPADSGYAAWEKAPTIDSNGVLTINYAQNHSQILCCVYYFKNKVDLTNFSTLYLIGSMTDNNDNWSGYPHMAVMSSVGEPPKEVASVGGSKTNPSIDVSELSGEYYIGFIMMSQGSTSPGTILKMSDLYLE